MNRKKGFTLVELLVVITIITLLVSLLVVLISSVIDKARYAKTTATIKMLDDGCKTYRMDFNIYPPNDKGGSASLYHHLGIPRKIIMVHSDLGRSMVSTKPPILEFQRDVLAEVKGALPDPMTHPVAIVDAFDNPIRYLNPGKYNKKGIDIWSPGKNGKDELVESAPGYDDVTNWTKEW